RRCRVADAGAAMSRRKIKFAAARLGPLPAKKERTRKEIEADPRLESDAMTITPRLTKYGKPRHPWREIELVEVALRTLKPHRDMPIGKLTDLVNDFLVPTFKELKRKPVSRFTVAKVRKSLDRKIFSISPT